MLQLAIMVDFCILEFSTYGVLGLCNVSYVFEMIFTVIYAQKEKQTD
jgi:hypothetical protein